MTDSKENGIIVHYIYKNTMLTDNELLKHKHLS